jgi:hypothetical protein
MCYVNNREKQCTGPEMSLSRYVLDVHIFKTFLNFKPFINFTVTEFSSACFMNTAQP